VKLARFRRPKQPVSSHIWIIGLIQTQQYCEKHVTVRRSHVRMGEEKKEVKKVNMIDAHCIQE
jgi:hypothetical protein